MARDGEAGRRGARWHDGITFILENEKIEGLITYFVFFIALLFHHMKSPRLLIHSCAFHLAVMI